MADPWREGLSRLRGLRFSLATCILAVLFLSATVATWVNRPPWVVVRSCRLPDFSNESPHLYLLGEEGLVLVHRPMARQQLATWNWHSGVLESVALPMEEVLLDVAPDVARFLTTDKKGTARIRQVGLMQPLAELPHWVFPTAQNLRLSADGNRVAGCGPDGAVWLYDATTQQQYTFPPDTTPPGRVYLEFSHDAHWLQVHESPGQDITAPSIAWKLIDCRNGQPAGVPPDIRANCLQWGPERCTFAESDNLLFVGPASWRIGSERMIPCAGEAVYDGSPTSIALVRNRSHIEVWDKNVSTCVGRIDLPPQQNYGLLRVSPRGTHLTCLTYPEDITCLWDTVAAKTIHVFPAGIAVHHFLDEEHLLALDAQRGLLQVWWRRRNESPWGTLGQPELWMALIFLAVTVYSIRRDQRRATG